jgi:hypothetical protein
MRRILAILLLAVSVVPMTGCVSDQPEDPNRVSTIPWNRPERWEGKGPLGGFAPGSQ